MSRLMCVVLAVGALGGCQSLRHEADALRPLAPPVSFARHERLQFQGSLVVGGHRLPMYCVLELSEAGLAFAAFAEIGQPIFSFSLTSAGVRFHASNGIPGIVPERIVADLQLAYWPVDVLERAFVATDWSLVADGVHRHVGRSGRPAATVVHMDDGDVVVHDRLVPYLLRLDRISPAPP